MRLEQTVVTGQMINESLIHIKHYALSFYKHLLYHKSLKKWFAKTKTKWKI